MTRGVLDLWNHWSIEILVLLSLALQLFLFIFAGIRRCGAHTNPVLALRFMLWLAYLLADSTAIFTLGHISLSGTSTREHRLVSFWAPFLLQHLGGPDNLTAYSLQDNQLWRRHLQILLVQVLGAAYVLYKQIAANGLSVLVASALMFSVGAVKYAERTWALRCGDLRYIWSSIIKERPARHGHFHPHNDSSGADEKEESILRRAHSLFYICKRGIVDSSVLYGDSEYHDTAEMLRPVLPNIWPLMEMELSLMYDILYTKAAVIHTWFGYSVRLFSPLTIVASLLLFHFSGEDGHSGIDVVITYVLLGGALFMETTSLVNALGSTWAFAFLCTTRWSWLRYQALCTARWDRLRRVVASLHQLVKAAVPGTSSYKSRRWAGTMRQYNMLHFCTRPDGRWTTPLFGRLLKMVWLRDWWDRRHYSGFVKITDLVKEHVFSYIKLLYQKDMVNTKGVVRNKWGEEALYRHRSSLDNHDYDVLRISLGDEF
ncbi:hypothetical protein HU200_041043 [Digitaria exilis]|uniref:DUF4220 domain-containing protein n=1 Tax=Digitaria exilis TaxID=1010633 RepID=A0A835B9P1_9POAL|nr:hypothetical protein HU200_041043 [Digitaria exilis]